MPSASEPVKLALRFQRGYTSVEMLRTTTLLVTLIVLIAAPVAAQYGELLLQVSDSEVLSAGTAILLVGQAAGTIQAESDAESARALLAELGFRLARAQIDEPITEAWFAMLCAQLFDLRGDIGYSLLPGPLRAHRLLRERGYFPNSVAPGALIPGTDAIGVVRRLTRDTP